MTRTTAQAAILAAARKGWPVTPAMVCADIHTLEELDGYRRGLSARGALTSEAMAAIRMRQDEITGGRG